MNVYEMIWYPPLGKCADLGGVGASRRLALVLVELAISLPAFLAGEVSAGGSGPGAGSPAVE